jgi:hypothetical protein
MKAISFFFAIVIATVLFSSCDQFDEKRFSTTIPYTFEVSATTDNNGEATIDLNGLIDALELNANLAEVKDKIQRYELIDIKYKVFEYYDSPATTLNGSIGFGNKNMTEAGTTFLLNDISLQSSMDNADPVKIDFVSAEVANIQQYFFDTNGMKLFLKGLVSQTPVHFKFYLQVDIDAIAEVKK